MTKDLSVEFKVRLHNYMGKLLTKKMEDLQEQVDQILDSANENAKSSMGDKYETGRAMAHREQEKLEQQIHEASKMHNGLENLPSDKSYSVVQPGALVKTSQGLFYFSVPLVKVPFEDQTVFALSINSPVGQKLKGLEVGQSADLNGRKFKVETII